jgi:predicted phosphohydrolase
MKHNFKIQIVSDLHTEVDRWSGHPPENGGYFTPEYLHTDADLVLLSGDIDHAVDSVSTAQELFPGKTIVMIPGNHEFYHSPKPIEHNIQHMKAEAAKYPSIHVLEDDVIVLDIKGIRVRIIGSVLWTDYNNGYPGMMSYAKMAMNDYKKILGSDGFSKLEPAELLGIHRASVEFIENELAKPHDGPTIVMTHYLPSMRSIHKNYRQSPTNALYASNLDRLLESQAVLWTHGHTHKSMSYSKRGGALVVCNPCGYNRDGINENAEFNPKLTVDCYQAHDMNWKVTRPVKPAPFCERMQ